MDEVRVLAPRLFNAEVVELGDTLSLDLSGSNPVGVRVPPSAPFFDGLIAQRSAHLIVDQEVAGSSPAEPAIFRRG